MVEVLCARGAELHSEAWHLSHTPGERRNHASLPGLAHAGVTVLLLEAG